MAGYEDDSHLQGYFLFLDRLIPESDEQLIQVKNSMRDLIVAYLLSNRLRAGKIINITKYLEN